MTNLRPVLERAHRGGFKTKSDFARTHADLTAIAASAGLISTKLTGNTYGTTWFITSAGLEVLRECFQGTT